MLQTSIAQDLFTAEKQSIEYFFHHLDIDLMEKVVQLLDECSGTIICTGVGKSSFIAKKLAATMISTGTKALFLDPTDAVHGDLGGVHSGDIVLMFSKSGETAELLSLVPYIRNKGAQTIAIVSNSNSRLAKASSLAILLPLEKELCPFGLAPTISGVIQTIFSDVITVALMRLRNFSLEAYALNHPAGSIGKRIAHRVRDLMITGQGVPLCKPCQPLREVLPILSEKQCGSVLVIDAKQQLVGIFTDGDLRRSLEQHGGQMMDMAIENLMTKSPKAISVDLMVADALDLMEEDQKHPIMVLPVIDASKSVVGIIKLHDILQAGF